jgi:hypothetical protein
MMKDQAVAVLLVIAIFAIGCRLVRDSRESRKTGVARIFFQWPSDIDRETHATQFRISVFLAAWVGYGLIVGASFGVLGILLQLIHPIKAAH